MEIMDKNVKFDLRRYWNERYRLHSGSLGQGSGAGSQGVEAQWKADYVNKVIKDNKIISVQEYGCGSGMNLCLYEGMKKYCGYDIAERSIKLCESQFLNYYTCSYYFTMDLNRIDYHADLALCLDVMFHQVNDSDYDELVKLMFHVAQHKYILIYSTDHDEFGDAHVRHRNITNDLNDIKTFKLLNQTKYPNGKYMLLYERTL